MSVFLYLLEYTPCLYLLNKSHKRPKLKFSKKKIVKFWIIILDVKTKPELKFYTVSMCFIEVIEVSRCILKKLLSEVIWPNKIIIFYVNKLLLLANVVMGDSEAFFTIATTPRCKGGLYSFPWIAPLYF